MKEELRWSQPDRKTAFYITFLRFSMRFEFHSEMLDHSVCESRDPSLTIFDTSSMPTNLGLMIMTSCPVRVVGYVVM